MSDKVSSGTTKNTMPPGMIMGPDGKPCKICTAFRNWKPTAKNESAGKSRAGGQNSMAGVMAALAYGTSSASPPTSADTPPANCPPDVEQLGRATWTFLHTTAAYYPDRPTPNQRANMLSLIHSLPTLYPCSHCASHLGDNFKDHPPDVSGRAALSRWLCERHNDVNERLGKENFDCGKMDERWRDGPDDGTCG